MQLRTDQLEMDVNNKSRILLPGLFARVSLDLTNAENVFVVPKTAVTGNSKQIVVIRISNGKTAWIPIQKGREDADKVEIFGKLQEGDSLVIAATDELKSGTMVQVAAQ
jgi:multidrug efflux pump subunit AcrA (membrane-fusion protein)